MLQFLGYKAPGEYIIDPDEVNQGEPAFGVHCEEEGRSLPQTFLTLPLDAMLQFFNRNIRVGENIICQDEISHFEPALAVHCEEEDRS